MRLKNVTDMGNITEISRRPLAGEGKVGGSRWLALYILCMGFLMIVLDQTIVNVALPSIKNDLGFSQAGLAWVVNAYLIAFGGFLLLAGRLGDLLGRKRIFLIGLGMFTAASLICGLSISQPMLVAARFLQGIGGAVSSAVILGMVVTMFPEPAERAKAIGIFSFVASAGASIGLLAGGLITQAVSWHWIFFVNLPIGIIIAILASRLLESDRGIGLRSGADALGAVLITSGLMLVVYTIVESSTYGLGSLRTLGLGAVAIGLVVGFIVRQATATTPLRSRGGPGRKTLAPIHRADPSPHRRPARRARRRRPVRSRAQPSLRGWLRGRRRAPATRLSRHPGRPWPDGPAPRSTVLPFRVTALAEGLPANQNVVTRGRRAGG